jgi:hypothetical protein
MHANLRGFWSRLSSSSRGWVQARISLARPLGGCRPSRPLFAKSQIEPLLANRLGDASRRRTYETWSSCSLSPPSSVLRRLPSSPTKSSSVSVPLAQTPWTPPLPPPSSAVIAPARTFLAPWARSPSSTPPGRTRPPPRNPPGRPWSLPGKLSRSRVRSPLWCAGRSAEQAPRRPPPPPAPVPVPVAGPQPAPGSRTEARFVREYARIRSTVAAFEAAHLERRSPPRPPPPTGGVTAIAPRDLAGLLLPDGTSVAHALAARDARIAQLHFELTDRERRHRFASIDRAAAFVHNPSNQLAAPPPSPPPLPSGQEPVLPSITPCGASSPALPRVLLPLRLPRVPRLARRPPSSGARADPATPALVARPGVAPASPPLPGP